MKKNIYLLLIVILGMGVASCNYDYIVLPEPPIPNDTLSFAADIIPVFTLGNNCIICHNTGGQSPDLTTNNAYQNIISDGLINTVNPEASILYDFVRPGTNSHNWKKYTAEQAGLVLAWISQGGLNN